MPPPQALVPPCPPVTGVDVFEFASTERSADPWKIAASSRPQTRGSNTSFFLNCRWLETESELVPLASWRYGTGGRRRRARLLRPSPLCS